MPATSPAPAPPLRVWLAGATGTIGQATAAALLADGHSVICPVRPASVERARALLPTEGTLVPCDVTDPTALRGLSAKGCDALVSCMASRTGLPADAWAIDHAATVALLEAARDAGARRVALLSAICVQKPRLAFQHAKLAAEAAMMASGLAWSIVRPTAFFKSVTGQLDRVRAGRPYLLFGDGRQTACTPISDADLGRFIAGCLTDPARANRILPVGGPGPALNPLEIGDMMFDLTGQPPRFRQVPLALMDVIAGGLALGGRVLPRLRDKAEMARIGRYYATESMLVWDAARNRYDAEATPAFGTDTLRDHLARLVAEGRSDDRGDHAVF